MHQRDPKKNEHNGLSGLVPVWFSLFTLNSCGDPFGNFIYSTNYNQLRDNSIVTVMLIIKLKLFTQAGTTHPLLCFYSVLNRLIKPHSTCLHRYSHSQGCYLGFSERNMQRKRLLCKNVISPPTTRPTTYLLSSPSFPSSLHVSLYRLHHSFPSLVPVCSKETATRQQISP